MSLYRSVSLYPLSEEKEQPAFDLDHCHVFFNYRVHSGELSRKNNLKRHRIQLYIGVRVQFTMFDIEAVSTEYAEHLEYTAYTRSTPIHDEIYRHDVALNYSLAWDY